VGVFDVEAKVIVEEQEGKIIYKLFLIGANFIIEKLLTKEEFEQIKAEGTVDLIIRIKEQVIPAKNK